MINKTHALNSKQLFVKNHWSRLRLLFIYMKNLLGEERNEDHGYSDSKHPIIYGKVNLVISFDIKLILDSPYG